MIGFSGNNFELFMFEKAIAYSNEKNMIRHTVVFKLKHRKHSKEEETFLKAASKLSLIPGVHNFDCLHQISKKNNFDFGIVMEFDSIHEYDNYSNHPDHLDFVNHIWLKEVESFMEIDFEPIEKEA